MRVPSPRRQSAIPNGSGDEGEVGVDVEGFYVSFEQTLHYAVETV